ncbi:hypothetical protein DRO61_09110, partial [Candidatus Bathyarchaeota archaeon]
MHLMGKCCELCTHTLVNPCIDYIPCRTQGPLCHSNDECKAKIVAELDKITYGENGLRINVGMSSCGLATGAQEVYDTFRAEIDKHDLKAKLVNIGCLGSCYAEVIVEIIKKDYSAVIYNNVKPQKVANILDTYLSGDATGAFALRSRFGTMKVEDNVPLLDELDWFKYQVREVLQNCGIIDPESIEEYITHGGYLALTRVLKEMTPEEVIAEV